MTTFIIILIVILIILYIHHKAYLEPFVLTQSNEPISLLIFVSKSCGHCVNYNKNHHDAIVQLANKKGIQVKRIFADDDPEKLFDKFGVMYVPAGFIMKGDKIHKNLGSNVNLESIQTALA